MSDVIAAKGRNGQIEFDGRTVTIKREGLLARSTYGKSGKTIPLRHITAVQFKPASALVYGFLELATTGDTGKKRRARGTVRMNQEENGIGFGLKQQGDFVAVRDAIQQAIIDL